MFRRSVISLRMASIAVFATVFLSCQAQNSGQNEPSTEPPVETRKPAAAADPAAAMNSAFSEICGQTTIPIRLPTKLPKAFAGIQAAHGAASMDEYRISLYYEDGIGDAGFAGFFSGSKTVLDELPNTNKVNLANGNVGLFRAVSCGGSCAPANMWWEQDGVMYTIQIKLPSDMSEGEQESMLTETANSAITAEARKACPK
jgi:hypothetical protein